MPTVSNLTVKYCENSRFDKFYMCSMALFLILMDVVVQYRVVARIYC